MMLTLTRRVYKAMGGLGNYLGIANWLDTWNRLGNHAIGKAIMRDRLDRICSMAGYRQAK